MGDILEILIIEDNPKQIIKAARSIPSHSSLAGCKKIEIDIIGDYAQYASLTNSRIYDGIISNIFFPYNKEGRNEKGIEACNSLLNTPEFKEHLENYTGHYKNKILELIGEWQSGKTPLPLGGLVAHEAMKENIPCVLITEKHIRNPLLDPVFFQVYNKDVPIIDVMPGVDYESKKWRTAWNALELRIEDKSKDY